MKTARASTIDHIHNPFSLGPAYSLFGGAMSTRAALPAGHATAPAEKRSPEEGVSTGSVDSMSSVTSSSSWSSLSGSPVVGPSQGSTGGGVAVAVGGPSQGTAGGGVGVALAQGPRGPPQGCVQGETLFNFDNLSISGNGDTSLSTIPEASQPQPRRQIFVGQDAAAMERVSRGTRYTRSSSGGGSSSSGSSNNSPVVRTRTPPGTAVALQAPVPAPPGFSLAYLGHVRRPTPVSSPARDLAYGGPGQHQRQEPLLQPSQQAVRHGVGPPTGASEGEALLDKALATWVEDFIEQGGGVVAMSGLTTAFERSNPCAFALLVARYGGLQEFLSQFPGRFMFGVAKATRELVVLLPTAVAGAPGADRVPRGGQVSVEAPGHAAQHEGHQRRSQGYRAGQGLGQGHASGPLSRECARSEGSDRSSASSSSSRAGSLKERVVCEAAEILKDAATQSLKAVELANTLRARLGTEVLAQVREQHGGLLSLLERHTHIFHVDRIPKSDCVTLVAMSPLPAPSPGGAHLPRQHSPPLNGDEDGPFSMEQTIESAATRCLHIGNVPMHMSEDELRRSFEVFGRVEGLRVVAQRGHRFAFVNYMSLEEAINAKASLSRQNVWRSAVSFARRESFRQQHMPGQRVGRLEGHESSAPTASLSSLSGSSMCLSTGYTSDQSESGSTHHRVSSLAGVGGRPQPPRGLTAAHPSPPYGSADVKALVGQEGYEQAGMHGPSPNPGDVQESAVLSTLTGDHFVPTQAWPASFQRDWPYVNAMVEQLRQVGGSTTVSKLRGLLKTRLRSPKTIKSVPLKALLQAYGPLFALNGNRVSLLQNSVRDGAPFPSSAAQF